MTYNANKEIYKIEAQKIFQSVFASDCPDIIIDRYIQLHEIYFLNSDKKEIQMVQEILKNNLDIVATELYLRGKHPLLSKKIGAIIYLAEALEDYHHFYYLENNNNFFVSCFKIGFSLIRSFYLSIKGQWVLKKYGII